MSRASLVLLVAIAVLFGTATSQNQCPENQEWIICGSACPPSCTEPNPQFCTYNCITGCQCRQGLLLNSRGDCVSPSEC
ncbi:chymotrypsin inhibitor-like [Harpegnathos saltator]|uniref:chymotrypsin inhibitor-like n=1 Tax=Harpegnathos saltator TaxID=610380 RepID=UPI000DBEED75|nr:chymotrypsin inhibitor-like [Harpegnathos saltator]